MSKPTEEQLAEQERLKSSARALAGGSDFVDLHLVQVDAIATALMDGTLPGNEPPIIENQESETQEITSGDVGVLDF
jgi:hypothetical protein